MSRAEKFLPYILAIITPILSIVSNNTFKLWDKDLPLTVFKYLEASTVLLILWFLNKALIERDFLIKRKLGTTAFIILSNSAFIVFITLFDNIIIPDGITSKLELIPMMVRFGLIAVIFNIIQRVFKTQRERASLEMQNLELQAEKLKFHMETLKQQINPHFLFNSLNTLLDLIEEDQQAAAKLVRNFSNLYRIVLQHTYKDFIQLKDEISFLEDYWSLLEVRFKDAIKLKMEPLGDYFDYLIPPLSLQFLVENAVKHNEVSRKQPLTIVIYVENDWLIVKNQINPLSYPVAGEQVGLKNLQQRFTLLHKPIEYGVDDDYFIVKIPLKS
ncbi:MAG: histidine kinase [Bacteroidota bacterium]